MKSEEEALNQSEKEEEFKSECEESDAIAIHKKFILTNLLSEQGTFSIQNGNHVSIEFKHEFPAITSCIQIEHTLYVCGGCWQKAAIFQYVGLFFSAQLNGDCTILSPLIHERRALSLSGIFSHFIAVGGYTRLQNLNVAEQYRTATNKWKQLPSLSLARILPTSCILPSNQAMVFCGSLGAGNYLNQIQKLQLDHEMAWETISLHQSVSKNCHLSAVSFYGNIILFGGARKFERSMHILNEDGKVMADLSQDRAIPGCMNQFPSVVHRGRVYAIGLYKFKGKMGEAAHYFTGAKWAII